MQIGRYRVRSVLCGFFALDGGSMFGVVPRPLWSKHHTPDDQGRIRLALRALLVEGDGRRVLIDTGVGSKWSSEHAERYGIDPKKQRLEEALARLGCTPEDITDVILTHLHFDHAGGATRIDSQGKLVPTFPAARHYLQRRNLEVAREPGGQERASYLEENFKPLEDAGLLHLLTGGGELFDGLRLIISDGHTTAQQLVFVAGEPGASVGGLLYCGDVVPSRSHVPLSWHMAFDVRPLLLAQEKALLLERALRDHWLLCYEHDPDVAATEVEQHRSGFRAGQEVRV